MYVVNYDTQLRSRDLFFNIFVPEENVFVTQPGPHIETARISEENPDLISPVVENKKICKKNLNMNSLHIALSSSELNTTLLLNNDDPVENAGIQ